MVDKVGFVAKVLGLAWGLAVLIKWLGPKLAIPPSSALSLVVVLLPSLVMGLVLLWRWSTSGPEGRSRHRP